MLDATGKTKTVSQTVAEGPPADFQAHLRALDARGLVTRIDRPIDKDRELHPRVRWQFQGGLREDGLDALGGSPDDFRRFIRSETERWARVIRDIEAAKKK